ncbi:MAG: hypothetical protein J2P19_18040 [Pseudonocardia sp.]|nr:hypothetical protein [Pseudonocardia sp.]
MADIQVDPDLLRVRATQLAALADGLATLTLRVRSPAAGAEALEAGLAARHTELCAALARDVDELTRLAEGLRREAETLTECDQSARQRLSKIDRELAVHVLTSGPG